MGFYPFAATIGGIVPPLPIASGGTNGITAAAGFANLAPLTTAGDLIIENATPAPARLAVGTAGQLLTASSSGLPAWTGPGAAGNWGPADQALLAWNIDPGGAIASSAALGTAGTLYVQAIPVRTALTVTNIVTVLVANGSVLTSGQCFAALYQGAAGALIGVTADQSVNWGAGASKVVTMALASGPFAVNPGIVYVAYWFNGTTGPAFARFGGTAAVINAGLAAAASRWGTANTAITTTAPGTLGTIAAAGNAYWAALS